ncbi:MAG: MBOAT family protein [Oscillospiraceae bacterium]|nr:MBOAT family protein [Oscillospiraceae bacterium]
MSFDTAAYLLFLPAVTALHWLCPSKARWAVLLAASLLFYMSWDVPLTLLLLTVAGVSWLAGLALTRWERPSLRRLILFLSLAVCLGLLGYFKYFNFLAGSLYPLFTGKAWSAWDIVLPVGCSFYVFQAVSYVADVYRGTLPAERHPGYYALYLSFFPQLVAGPIERAGDLLPQLRGHRRLDREDVKAGLRLLLSGFFRKVVIADFCGPFVTAAYSADAPDGSAVLIGTLLFALQIYCDFAGYSEIAAGSARLLGVKLMRNFDRPYLSCGFREFWRRWHISLSRWLTDYVYIPLGGSRRGLARQLFAVFAVFAASGLWHGANWTFVVWGLLHGVLFASELLIRRAGIDPARSRTGKAAAAALTFALVAFCWIFFRAGSLTHAAFLIGRLFSPWDPAAGLACLNPSVPDAIRLALILALCPALRRLTDEDAQPRDMTWVYFILSIAAAWLIRYQQGGAGTFIYFQF